MTKKNPCLSSLLALAIASTAGSALAGGSAAPLVDSTLSFTLRIVGSGPESERNNLITNRFEATRFGSREALALLEELSNNNGFVEVINPTSEGFPRGSRLVATTGGSVLVVDREGNTLMNASSYLEVSLNRDRSVSAGSFNDDNGDRQATNLMVATLYYDFPNQNAVETAEESEQQELAPVSSDQGEASGLVSERNSRRYIRFRDSTTESATVSGRISGNGLSSGQNVVIDGALSLSGRQTVVDD